MRDSTGAPAHALPDCRGACAVAVSGPRGRVFPPGLRGPQRSPARSCHGLPAARAMGLSSDCPVRVEWIAAVTFAAGTAALGYLAYKKFYAKESRTKAMVNLQIQKDNPKVVHAFDMEDLGDKAVYCRCWRSKKFPFCDGAHIKHNEETGDNVGPLIIKKKET
ncbi:CDGSH iron-sulfur domain-containing protein 1 [Rattus rattus]|uniref:CDGSH iron-sulfur domain-containing protein 1 n=1 Tax=Rattus rattus TaxID=10117 RepID=UPI0013F3839E|nr:CDGSH iron-sulfur domain-containing protein 1 [Rattus rattus]